MPKTEYTDHLAAHRAQHVVADLLDAKALANAGGSAFAEAGRIVDEFAVQFEHRDGLRRVVLASEWEVDPADRPAGYRVGRHPARRAVARRQHRATPAHTGRPALPAHLRSQADQPSDRQAGPARRPQLRRLSSRMDRGARRAAVRRRLRLTP